MRRKDREIESVEEILEILDRCAVCRLGLAQDGQPYIVPLNYGYAWEGGKLTLYFHSAGEGRKLDILRENNRACFEVDGGHRLLEAADPCGHSFAYESVIGFGRVDFLTEREEKTAALNRLMQHQTGKDAAYPYSDAQLDAVTIYRLTVSSFTGKRNAVRG